MFEAPADAWYTWFGTAAVAMAVLGVALGLPTAPPPDAGAVADTVDSVAAGPDDATASRRLAADWVKISPHYVALRGPGGIARESLAYGPITPVDDEGPLARVLDGRPVATVFPSPSALERAASAARTGQPQWERANRLQVRTIVWEGVHVTLVGV